jgi:poly(beta-D-mannuronate) lyase
MMFKALSALLVLSSVALAAERTVSPKEVASAAAQAKAGDTIVIADGDYRDVVINFKAKGTAEKPITLRALTPGKVKFEGDYQLTIEGEHLVVSGLFFGESKSEKDVIEIRGIENRVTDCAIIALDRGGKWIHFMGRAQHCRLDHCYIEGHAPKDVRLQVEVDEKTPPEHRIDHNHFAHRPPLGENGGETMRLGYSYQSMFVSRTTVEDNLFTQCDGEIEIISSKSCENVYRHNTFRDCEGTLTLRHGNRCVVDGNFFFGNGGGDGAKKTGGVRVIGEDHKIVNNYFAKTAGIAGGVIALTAGIPDSELKGYWQIRKCLVANNVFVDNDAPCLLLDAGYNERNRTLLPENVTIENNTFVAPKTNAKPFVRGKEGQGFKWGGNVGSGAPRGDAPAEGFKIVDHVELPKKGTPIDESEVGPSWKVKPGPSTSSRVPDDVVLPAAAERAITQDVNAKAKVTHDPAAKSLVVRGANGPEAKAASCPQVISGQKLAVAGERGTIDVTSSGASKIIPKRGREGDRHLPCKA